ncbi:MAG: aroE, partial [Halothiobacillaceae bacterium]
VMAPLLQQKPALLVVANRTPDRARQLADDFSAEGPVRGCGFAELEGQYFDLIINGTASGLSGEIPALPIRLLEARPAVYDMMYSKEPTPFIAWALANGAIQACDGLGMLVEQAAEAFYLWRGVRPATAPVMVALRA